MADKHIEARPTISIRVETPDGTLFVNIHEFNDRPIRVIVSIGKSGSSLMAWADSLTRVISLALQKGVELRDVITEIAEISSDKVKQFRMMTIKSGPDGLAWALAYYNKYKYEQLLDRYHITDDEDEDDDRRGPKIWRY